MWCPVAYLAISTAEVVPLHAAIMDECFARAFASFCSLVKVILFSLVFVEEVAVVEELVIHFLRI